MIKLIILEENTGLLIGPHLPTHLPPYGVATTHNTVLQQIPTLGPIATAFNLPPTAQPLLDYCSKAANAAYLCTFDPAYNPLKETLELLNLCPIAKSHEPSTSLIGPREVKGYPYRASAILRLTVEFLHLHQR